MEGRSDFGDPSKNLGHLDMVDSPVIKAWGVGENAWLVDWGDFKFKLQPQTFMYPPCR